MSNLSIRLYPEHYHQIDVVQAQIGLREPGRLLLGDIAMDVVRIDCISYSPCGDNSKAIFQGETVPAWLDVRVSFLVKYEVPPGPRLPENNQGLSWEEHSRLISFANQCLLLGYELTCSFTPKGCWLPIAPPAITDTSVEECLNIIRGTIEHLYNPEKVYGTKEPREKRSPQEELSGMLARYPQIRTLLDYSSLSSVSPNPSSPC